MRWKDEYINLLIERLNLSDFKAERPTDEASAQAILDNLQQRLDILLKEALNGDDTAYALYMTLCEDYLLACKPIHKSDGTYQGMHKKILDNLKTLGRQQ